MLIEKVLLHSDLDSIYKQRGFMRNLIVLIVLLIVVGGAVYLVSGGREVQELSVS